MQYYYKDKIINYSVMDDHCPLCGGNVVLKAQRKKEGCIKVRYFKCVICEFDTRDIELKGR